MIGQKVKKEKKNKIDQKIVLFAMYHSFIDCASMCRYNLIIERPFHNRVSKLKLRKLLYLRSLLQDLAIDANADEI